MSMLTITSQTQRPIFETAAGGSFVGSSGPAPSIPGVIANSSRLTEKPRRVITTKPQLPISDHELRARIQWSHKASSHFVLSYDRIVFAEPQAHTLLDALEESYSLIFHFTHESFADRFQVYALDQRATSLLGRAVHPHFNLEERAIYLTQTSTHNAYAELVPYLTHAMRIARYVKHYGHTPGWALLEDGFSIFLSERLSILPNVFPFYGADVDLVAYSIQSKHHANLSTALTSWSDPLPVHLLVLSGAFFLYLGDTYSDDRIVTFSKSENPITNETFRDFFGATLEELERAWMKHLPGSLIALTHEEQEEMALRWERAIEYKK
jgi:hypothetical protein